MRVAIAQRRARCAAGFNLARIPGGVSGLGLVRALLPRRSATPDASSSTATQRASPTRRRCAPPGVHAAADAGMSRGRRAVRATIGASRADDRARRVDDDKGKILVVDDDRLVLATLTHGLTQAGYEVIDADNGDDAILLAREHRPDLALLDIRMEGKSGFDVAAYLREYCQMPFMFLSAFSDDDTVAQVKALGAVAYLVKPLDIGQIVPAVEAAFAHLRAQPRAAAPAHAPAPRREPAPLRADRWRWRSGVLMHRYSLARGAALRAAAAPGREAGQRAGATRPSGCSTRSNSWRAAGRGLTRGRAASRARCSRDAASGRQREVKARAAVDLGLGPDLAAMAAHDAPHRRQADAGAREVAGAVQALEHAEQAVGEAHVEAGAVVAHGEACRLAVAAALEARCCACAALAGVLPGVAEQVLEHHAQQRRVALRLQAGLDRAPRPRARAHWRRRSSAT